MYTKLSNGQIVYEEDYSCVLDPQGGIGGIFIGNLEAAQNLKTLKKNNIKSVLTAAKGVDLKHSKTDIPFYLQIAGEDRDGFDLSIFFDQAIKFIKDSLEKTNIMVHCLAGVSRSVCLVLAYLIKCRGMSYQQGYSMIKARRRIIHPNDGFIRQLKKFEIEQSRPSMHQSTYQNKGYLTSSSKNMHDSRNERYLSGTASRVRDFQKSRNQIFESPSKRIDQLEYSRVSGHYLPIHRQYESPMKRYNQRSFKHTPILENQHQLTSRHQQTDSSYQYIRPESRNYNSPNKLNTHDLNHEYSRNREELYLKTEGPRRRQFGGVSTNTRYNIGGFSTSQFSQQFDRKIQKIRSKYSQYTSASSGANKRIKQLTSFDENGLYGALSMKKVTSDIQKMDRINPESGLIRNNYLKGGLGLKRIHSLKPDYY